LLLFYIRYDIAVDDAAPQRTVVFLSAIPSTFAADAFLHRTQSLEGAVIVAGVLAGGRIVRAIRRQEPSEVMVQ
jgi:hypothetical protein